MKVYYDHLFGKGANSGTSIQYKCPFHDDKSPSMSVSKEHGGWKCHAGSCAESGDVFTAWMKVKNMGFGMALRSIAEWVGDPALTPARTAKEAGKRGTTLEIKDKRILRDLHIAQKNILTNEKVLGHLAKHYGVTLESVSRFKLGFDNGTYRLWIPIYHKNKLCGIRKHDIMRAHCVWIQGTPAGKDTLASPNFKMQSARPDNPEDWKAYFGSKLCRSAKPRKQGGKVIGIRGHNSLTLYPSQVLGREKMSLDEARTDDTYWTTITGGELKAIFLNQNKVAAVTFTGAEGGFTVKWLRRFTGLDVEIAMDADAAGVAGATKLAKELAKYARRVRIIHLPEGDVNDYYRSKGFVFDDWMALPRTVVKDESRRKSKVIRFKDLREADLVGQEVQFRAIVAGSGETPFFVPSEMKIKCNKGFVEPMPSCGKCGLAGVGFEMSAVVPAEDLIEIRMKGPRKQTKYLLEQVAGIPERCPHPEATFKSSRIAEIGIVKDVDIINDWNEADQGQWFVQKVYYVDKGNIPENEPAQCFGKIIADPTDSRATMVLRKLQPVSRSFETQKVSAKSEGFLTTVPGSNASKRDIVTRIAWYADEFEERITHIYEQKPLILGSLLLWFMPIRFKLFGRINEKISAEVLLIGDTRAGKTSVSKTMLGHFKAGRFVQCEGATFAGLVGGSGEHGSKKFFTWGVLPSQDGGFVFMDEIDDIVRSGVFSQLTSIRSDGVASRVIAGGVRQASSRLRMLMASNPLGNRRMRSYSSTMFAINELLKAPQDVARYEFAIGVYRPDSPEVYNKLPDETPSPYTTDIAAEHVRWAWRQRPEIIGEVANHVLDVSSDLSHQFKELVLLTASEARWKLARLASAIAALCYSQRQGKIVVNKHHVDVAADFLRSIYGNDQFGYSKFVKNEDVDSPDLRRYMKLLGPEVVRYLNDNDSFNNDMLDTMVDGKSNRRDFMRNLTMTSKCIKKHRAGWIKTQGFKNFLGEYINEL